MLINIFYFPKMKILNWMLLLGRKLLKGQHRESEEVFYFSNTIEKSAKLDNLGIVNKPAI